MCSLTFTRNYIPGNVPGEILLLRNLLHVYAPKQESLCLFTEKETDVLFVEALPCMGTKMDTYIFIQLLLKCKNSYPSKNFRRQSTFIFMLIWFLGDSLDELTRSSDTELNLQNICTC